MDLIKLLSDVAKRVNEKIPGINSGGCCVFAAEVYPYLKGLGLKPKIRVADRFIVKECTIEKVRRKVNDRGNIDDWNDNGLWFGHVVCEFEYKGKSYFFDSKKVYVKKEECEGVLKFNLYKGNLTYNEGVMLASSSRGWNRSFDRKQIQKMRDTLEKQFRKVYDLMNG